MNLKFVRQKLSLPGPDPFRACHALLARQPLRVPVQFLVRGGWSSGVVEYWELTVIAPSLHYSASAESRLREKFMTGSKHLQRCHLAVAKSQL